MVELIAELRPKARKDHDCHACEFLNGYYDFGLKDLVGIGLSFSEWRQIIKAKNNKWKIKKGDIYLRQTVRYDEISTFKAIPEIHEICIKHDLYPKL